VPVTTRDGRSAPPPHTEVAPTAHRGPDYLTELRRPRRVVQVGVLLVLAHLALRAWALYGSWFYTDDYRLLTDARRSDGWTADLLRPFDSQFMPLGRLAAEVVAGTSPVSWPLAASLVLGAQLVASLACLVMLLVLFGRRPAVLPLLALYLTSAITWSATMWWAAALNQVPFQAVLFASVTTWVLYLRGRGRRWLAATLALVVLGLACYIKALLLLPLLAGIAVAFFARGGPRARVVHLVRRHPGAVVAGVVLGAAAAAAYVVLVPQAFSEGQQPLGPGVVRDLVRTMLLESYVPGMWGGPWRWDESIPPTSYADAPVAAVVLALLATVLLVGATLLVRRRAGRAWVLLLVWLAADFVLLLLTRVPVAGPSIGREYRYLTDAAPVTVLVLGLVLLPLAGAPEGSTARRPVGRLAAALVRPAARPALRAVAAVAVVGVLAGGLLSGRTYVGAWHDRNPGAAYVQAAQAAAGSRGVVDLADTVVPPYVMPGVTQPFNTSRTLLDLTTVNVRFPDTTEHLGVLGDDGLLRQAVVGGVSSLPGPDAGCGWGVDGRTVIPLERAAFEFDWWLQVGYLSASNQSVVVRAGDSEVEVPLRAGVHNVYVRVSGEVDDVVVRRSSGSDPSNAICVDSVVVGLPSPGGLL